MRRYAVCNCIGPDCTIDSIPWPTSNKEGTFEMSCLQKLLCHEEPGKWGRTSVLDTIPRMDRNNFEYLACFAHKLHVVEILHELSSINGS